MKKFLCCLMVVLAVFLFAGCNISSTPDEEEIEQLVNNGKFYTLPEAYEKGWLSKDDLKSIAYYHNGGIVGNEEVMGENFQPQPKSPETLSETVTLAIRQKYCNSEQLPSSPSNEYFEYLGLSEYCGLYNGCLAVVMSDGVADQIISNETVNGVTMFFTYENRILILTAKEKN